MKTLIILLIALISLPAYSARLLPIEDYRYEFCNGNRKQNLNDGTVADCYVFKDNLVVKVAFADNWNDGFGKAIHYSIQSNKKPGLALIIEKTTDCRHVKRAIAAIRNTYLRMMNGEMVRIELRQTGPLRCITGTITQ